MGRPAALAAVLLAVLLTGCTTATGSSDDTSGATDTSTTTAGSASLTGPVVAVKIDNVDDARPSTGLSQAKVVYVEPVEGGLSRIVAVFTAPYPGVIGPVRSARQPTSTCWASTANRCSPSPVRCPSSSRCCTGPT